MDAEAARFLNLDWVGERAGEGGGWRREDNDNQERIMRVDRSAALFVFSGGL